MNVLSIQMSIFAIVNQSRTCFKHV